MADIVPLRPEDTFASDAEREMIDYLIGQVKEHAKGWGETPHTAAIVLTSDKGRSCHSFSLEVVQDRLATCSSAAALLLKRGTDDE